MAASARNPKRSYLVAYDYGQGGVWALIDARSPDEITAKYPEVAVVDTRPQWMTADMYDKIVSIMHLDIDDAPIGWLATVVEQRSREKP